MAMEGLTIIETPAFQELISKIDSINKILETLGHELAESKKPYLTVSETMELTGFGKTWVMANKQDIGYSSVGGSIRFKRKDVGAFMESNYFKTKTPRRSWK